MLSCMLKRRRAALVLGIPVAMALAAGAHAAVKVVPVSVNEQRYKSLETQKDGFSMGGESLTVQVRLEGREVEGAKQAKKLTITEAKDDTGQSLKPEEQTFFGGGFGMSGFGDDDKKPKGLPIDIRLEPASRKATKIVSIKGTAQVMAGGQAKVVSIGKLTTMFGKAVTDPALTAAGVKVTVLDPKKAKAGLNFGGGDEPGITLEITGPEDAIEKMEVLDGGKNVSNGSSSFGMNDKRTTTLSLEKPLNDAMTVKLHLMVGQKLVDVPIDLKDIPLP